MQIRRSTLDFYLVERTEDERQSPRYLYLGGINDGREEKLLIFAAISRIPRLRVIEGARGFALADRRETRAKTFPLQMENSRSHALYHIAINSKREA